MLSILIPVYNYNVSELVNVLHRQCIDSGIDFEILVREDFSESIYTVANKQINTLHHCRLLLNTKNLGRTVTRHLLADDAKYEMLLFLDADVMPVSDAFINAYIPYIKPKTPVVCGGIAYRPESSSPNTILRYKYGCYREQKTASERNKNPYGNILSGNLLVKKAVFFENNYSEQQNLYGMDNILSYNLYNKKIPVVHIDNTVYHLGLEPNELFFKKSLDSVKNRKNLLSVSDGIENINSLLAHYKKLKKYHLVLSVQLLFKISEPLLKKMILKKNPSLFCLDIYRLGYICTLK